MKMWIARDAADTLNYWSPSAITACCKGKRKTAVKGWHWKYYQPTELVKDLIEAGFKRYPKDDSQEEQTCYLALAQKWLREEKHIEVLVLSKGMVGSPYCFQVYTEDYVVDDDEKYGSYEEALVEGVRKATEILKEDETIHK